MNDTEFLNWVADRLVYVYHEGENVDFVQRLRSIASSGVEHEHDVTSCGQCWSIDDTAYAEGKDFSIHE